jgi:hypothetical protein
VLTRRPSPGGTGAPGAPVARRGDRSARGGGEAGFTLVEMIVGVAIGLVIMIALFTLLDVATHQTTRDFTHLDATERARVAIANLENELHSACVTAGEAPIQAGSTGTSLQFVSYFGDAADPLSGSGPTPVWHDVVLGGGNLVDNTYAVNGTSPANWSQGASTGTTTLLTNVAPAGSTAPFQYFAYQEVPNGSGGYYSDGGGNPYMMLLDGTSSVPGTSPAVTPPASPLSIPLSAPDAGNAAEVMITLSVGGSGGTMENTNLADTNVTVQDQVSLRLTPPSNHVETGGSFEPCS